jgi:ActR/RegA family two-component response regulator
VEHDGVGRQRAASSTASGTEQPKKRIAILDDNGEFAWASSKALELRGYDAVGLTSEDALRSLSSSSSDPFEFVVIDYRLGHGGDGVQVGASILRMRPRARVVITSADDSIMDSVVKSGMKFLLKPFTIGELIRTLEDGRESPA